MISEGIPESLVRVVGLPQPQLVTTHEIKGGKMLQAVYTLQYMGSNRDAHYRLMYVELLPEPVNT